MTEPEEAWLKASSEAQPEAGTPALPDFSSMTEEEQIAYAMQMSLAGGGRLPSSSTATLHCSFPVGHFLSVTSWWQKDNSVILWKYMLKSDQWFTKIISHVYMN